MQFALLIAEEGPNTELSWLLYVALGFFLLMVIVGWLTSRRNDEQVEATNDADDLTSLEGIGPKVSKILNSAGIHSFADLAKANDKEVDKVLDEAGLQMMDSIGWIEQAKLAAKGDTKGLMKLQDELKGGRRAE
jgi:hypothetical protein